MTFQDLHLVLYGQTVTFGLAGRGTPRRHPSPGQARDFVALARRHGLGGVEFGPHDFPELESEPARQALAQEIQLHGLRYVVALGYPDPEEVRQAAPYARLLGARTIRCVGSSILCGERSQARPDWPTHLSKLGENLCQCGPILEEFDCFLAVENHQDLHSRELVELCTTTCPERIGVTLDTGNPLAVAEDILEFAQRVMPYVRNVHLKDYRVQITEEGYRLVRCALGQGVVDFPALLSLLAKAPTQPSYGIELAALQARHIRTATPDYWTTFPPELRAGYPALLDWLQAQAEPSDWDYRTPWEREDQLEEIVDYERTQLERSIAYLRDILGTLPPRADLTSQPPESRPGFR